VICDWTFTAIPAFTALFLESDWLWAADHLSSRCLTTYRKSPPENVAEKLDFESLYYAIQWVATNEPFKISVTQAHSPKIITNP
jgi:hypothetical protein